MLRITDIYSMCGIAGVISINQQLVTKDRLAKMTGAIAHRGHDGEVHWINETGSAGIARMTVS